jgi:hypothetical protein
MVDLWKAAPEELRQSHAIEVHDIGRATCMTSRGIEPAAVSRRAVRLGVGHPATEAHLDDVLAFMSRKKLKYVVPVAPQCQPAALASWLQARGFSRGRAWMKFCCLVDAAPQTTPDLDVRVVGSEMAGEFGKLVAEGFSQRQVVGPWVARLAGRQNWVCTMAFLQGKPIAAGALFMSGAYGWLGLGTTLSLHRRLGAQRALLELRLREAAARGAQLVVTETGQRVAEAASDSYRNILRVGFKEMYLRQNYFSPLG